MRAGDCLNGDCLNLVLLGLTHQGSRTVADMSKRAELIVIAGLCIAALAWHAVSVSWQSLFVDEWAELCYARLDAAGVWSNPDSMPPLFTYLLQGWLAVARFESAARWLSALLGVASILAVWQLGRELTDARGAVAAAALWTINPIQLYYSQSVRAYSLLALLVAAMMWLFFRALRTDARRDWAGFALLSATGMFTHYYVAILLLVAVVVLVTGRRGLPGRRAFMAFVAAGVLSAPVLFCLKTDFEYQREIREPRALKAEALAYTYFSLLSGYSLGPSTAELHTLPARDAVTQAAPLAAAMGFAALPLFIAGARELGDRRRLWHMAAFLVAPVVIAGVAGWATGITYNVRHVAWCAVPFTAWLGIGAAQAVQWRWLIAPTLGVAALMLSATYQRNWVARYQNEDLASAAEYLQKHTSGDPVFIVSDYVAGTLGYYLSNDNQLIELPEPGEVSRVVADDAVAAEGLEAAKALASGRGPVWLVYSRAFHGDPLGLLLVRLRNEFGLEPVAEFAGVKVFRSSR